MGLDLDAVPNSVAAVLAEFPKIELALTKEHLRQDPRLSWFASQPALELFPRAREPECALSGLLLLLGGWEECHRRAQDIDGPAGSYWHGIAHRIEPDFWNAGYWFRRVGNHPIYPELRDRTAAITASLPGEHWNIGRQWEPSAFLKLCENSVRSRDSRSYSLAVAIQSVEWELLFAWCAAPIGLAADAAVRL